jgi:hypothetical protein
VRRAFILITAVASLAACGSGSSKTAATGVPVTFGISGGNIAPLTIQISAAGKVIETVGTVTLTKRHVPVSTTLAAQSAMADVSSRQCKGTLPDVGSRFVIVGGETVTVHGNCEPAFETLWRSLIGAVGLD